VTSTSALKKLSQPAISPCCATKDGQHRFRDRIETVHPQASIINIKSRSLQIIFIPLKMAAEEHSQSSRIWNSLCQLNRRTKLEKTRVIFSILCSVAGASLSTYCIQQQLLKVTFKNNLTSSIDKSHGISMIELILCCTGEGNITLH
jgi:hypothetical protein